MCVCVNYVYYIFFRRKYKHDLKKSKIKISNHLGNTHVDNFVKYLVGN